MAVRFVATLIALVAWAPVAALDVGAASSAGPRYAYDAGSYNLDLAVDDARIASDVASPVGGPEGTAAPTPRTAGPVYDSIQDFVAPNTRPDFVAGPIGSEPPVPVSQSRMAAGFDEAGFPSTPTASPGVEYILPDGTKVRLMEPSGQAPMRASFTNANDAPINPFTGKPVQPPAPAGWSMKDWVRALTHVEQTP